MFPWFRYYGDLFAVNDAKTDAKLRNSSESIFEIPFSDGGNWNTWMFGVDETDPNSKYDWAKWLTPSRDLMDAYTQSRRQCPQKSHHYHGLGKLEQSLSFGCLSLYA